jgi:hypothetical protein
MLQRRHIRVQSPGPRVRRRMFSAGLADMMRAVGRGNGRREGMVTTGASSVRHERNCVPAVRAKMGVGIIRQQCVAIRAMIGKKKPNRTTQEARHRFCDMMGHRQPLILFAHFSLWRSACRCQGCPLQIYCAIRMTIIGCRAIDRRRAGR